MKFQNKNKAAHGGKRDNAGRKTDAEMTEVKRIATQHSAEAMQRLVYWMKSDNPKASITASMAIIERDPKEGKIPQAVTPVDDKGKVWQPYSITVKIDDGKGK